MSLEGFSFFQAWELGGNFMEEVAMVILAGVGVSTAGRSPVTLGYGWSSRGQAGSLMED